MPFPTDEARYAVAFFHPGSFEDPMAGLGTNPISPAGEGGQIARADQQAGTGALVGELGHGWESF